MNTASIHILLHIFGEAKEALYYSKSKIVGYVDSSYVQL